MTFKTARPKFSLLDLAPIKEGGSAGQSFAESRDLAVHAEKWGYNRYWLAEHHSMDGIGSSATAVLIGHICAATQTMRVGSGGVMLSNHSPLIIAEQFGTLESLYPGRIDLGLGRAPGTDQATMRALRRHHASSDHFDQQLEELMGHFTADARAHVRAVPGQGLHIPIWLLGSSLYSAKLAGLKGLPYSFAAHFAPEMMMEALEVYRSHFTPSEHLQSPYVMIGVQALAADSNEEAEYLMTTLYQRFLALVRNQSLKSKPPVKNMQELWTPVEAFHLKQKLAYAIKGDQETVRRELLRLVELTGAQELMITSDPYEHNHRLRSFEIIASALRD